MRFIRDLVNFVLMFATVAVIISSCNIAVSQGVGAWAEAGASKVESYEQTKRTAIEWDARVEIAEIENRTERETDGSYIVFWSVQRLFWIFLAATAGLAIWEVGRRRFAS